jgi:hypothetical protein
MADLSRAKIDSWLASLPDDVRSAIPEEDFDDGAAAEATRAMSGVSGAREVLVALEGAEDSFTQIGRAGRLRFLAWFAARPYSDAGAMRIMTGGDDDGSGDGAGVLGKVAPLFAADLRAFVEALGPRAARLAVDGETLAAVTGAGFDVASEMGMGGGL